MRLPIAAVPTDAGVVFDTSGTDTAAVLADVMRPYVSMAMTGIADAEPTDPAATPEAARASVRLLVPVAVSPAPATTFVIVPVSEWT